MYYFVLFGTHQHAIDIKRVLWSIIIPLSPMLLTCKRTKKKRLDTFIGAHINDYGIVLFAFPFWMYFVDKK